MVFPKIGVPQNGWFIMENPIKMDGLGWVSDIFGSTPIYLSHHRKRPPVQKATVNRETGNQRRWVGTYHRCGGGLVVK